MGPRAERHRPKTREPSSTFRPRTSGTRRPITHRCSTRDRAATTPTRRGATQPRVTSWAPGAIGRITTTELLQRSVFRHAVFERPRVVSELPHERRCFHGQRVILRHVRSERECGRVERSHGCCRLDSRVPRWQLAAECSFHFVRRPKHGRPFDRGLRRRFPSRQSGARALLVSHGPRRPGLRWLLDVAAAQAGLTRCAAGTSGTSKSDASLQHDLIPPPASLWRVLQYDSPVTSFFKSATRCTTSRMSAAATPRASTWSSKAGSIDTRWSSPTVAENLLSWPGGFPRTPSGSPPSHDVRLDSGHGLAGDVAGGDCVFAGVEPGWREILRAVEGQFAVSAQHP